ncbi:two-component system sensor histidine kinase/response regulator [Oxalobacteraceae bacterium GrIS 1.11]
MSLLSSTMPSRRAARYTVYGCALILLVTAATVYGVGQHERRLALAQIESRLSYRGASNAGILAREIENLRRDVLFLARMPPIEGIMRATANGAFDATENTPLALWRRRLDTIFQAYALTNPDVSQVRLIGMADQGRELQRVERSAGRIVLVPFGQLQAKGDTEYMRMGAQLAPGQVYVSDLSLNREHGQVQQPPMATVRAATPLFGENGKLFGMLVINCDMAAVLALLRSDLPNDFKAHLTNVEGDFLLHPDPARTFGFDLGRRWRWQDEFHAQATDAAAPARLQRYASLGGAVYAHTEKIALDARHPERYLTFTLSYPERALDATVRAAQLDALAAMLASALVLASAACLYFRQGRQASEHQARMAAIVDNSHDAIIGKTLAGVVTSWNRGAQQMFGYSAQEAIGKTLCQLIVPADAETEEATILQRIGRGEVVSDLSTVRRRRDGSLLTVSVTSSPIKAGDGRVVGAAKTVRDISKQVAVEARIRELNATLEDQVRERTARIEAYSTLQHAILSNAPYALIATDSEGLIRLFNPAAERMLGYAADEMLGLRSPTMLHDNAELAARAAALSHELGRAIAPGFAALAANARRGDDARAWTYVRKDGSRFPVRLSVSALGEGPGAIGGFLIIASDISESERDKRGLIAARDQLLTASDVAELGIWSWTLADNTLEWNERMYQFYDLPAQQGGAGLSYEDWRARVHPEDVDAAVAKLTAAVDGSGVYDPVFRIMQGDGQVRHIQAAASVERDASGMAVRVLGINRDISAQRTAEAALRAATLAADGANRAKSEFLANMSHEIRSPMNAVLGMLLLLKQTALDQHQLDYASKAEAAGRALLGILNDILDFSRVEAGMLTLDPQPFSIDALLRDVAVILSANVGEKDIEILYDIDPALPDWVVADAMRLQQVLINLAGNAIKFTADGEVVVSARLLSDGGAEGDGCDGDTLWLGFAIRDTGIGISPEQCRRIFDGFSQAEASTARRYGGSGLGLAISQRLVRLMGGSLTVESATGKGSTFSFRVACRRALAPAGVAHPQTARMLDLRCLVVDDNACACAGLAGMLGTFGWRVDTAGSGAEALAAITRRGDEAPYDVIFVDWRMPDMDGWQTSERIRQLLPQGSPPLIVMVTAHGREMLVRREHGVQAMLDGYLVKPVTASMLFDVVLDAISSKDAANDADQAEPVRATKWAAIPRSRLAGLRLLVVEDNPANQQVARELLAFDGAMVTVAGNGRAAIEAVRDGATRYDCVLMDIQMPDMDGYAATRAIRAEPGLADLPIIAMTANAMASDRAAAIEAGMNDHIGKPFDLAQLVAAIRRHAGRDALPEAEPERPAGDALQRPGFHGALALARFGGNIEAYRRALLGFPGASAALLAAIPATLSAQTQGGASRALHSLKGLAGTVGAQALAHIAEKMELALHAGPAPWEEAHRRLMVAGRRAAQASAELAGALAPAPPAPAPLESALAPAALAPALVRLRQLLAASDLDALSLFTQLQRDYGARMNPELNELESAIEQFNFAVAAGHCGTMLRRLAPDFS